MKKELKDFFEKRLDFLNNEIENLNEDSDTIIKESSELDGQIIELIFIKNSIENLL